MLKMVQSLFAAEGQLQSGLTLVARRCEWRKSSKLVGSID